MQDVNEALKKRLRVMVADMEESQQVEIIEKAAHMLGERQVGSTEKDLACKLKQYIEESYSGVDQWNVVIGDSFGCDVSHSSKGFLYFYIDEVAILLFKSK